MQEYEKQIAQWMFSTFWGVSANKASVYILKPCREIGQSFADSLREGKLVKDLELFWMNNKTINIIEFGFLSMWRIMQILVDVIHLGINLHILLSLIQ